MQWQYYTTSNNSIDAISPYLLTSYVKNRKWDLVQYYLYQAHIPNENRSYALHLACQDLRTPPYIIRMIYFAFPDAAIYSDAEWRTPLFIAVDNFFEEAAVFLSYQRPEASLIPNRVGTTPLQLALEGLGSNRILTAILKSHPMAIMQPDEYGVAFLESFFNERNCHLRAIVENDNNILLGLDVKMVRYPAHNTYSKGIPLLKAATMEHFSQSNRDSNNWHALHAACEVDACPWSFCKLLLQAHADEAMKTDVNGNLPIHIILSASKDLSDEHMINCSYCGTVEKVYYAPCKDDQFSGLCCNCHDEIEDAEERVNCMEPAHKVVETVRALLAIDTKMAKVPDENGNLPLTISILNEQDYITTKLIFDAAPEIGRKLNTIDGLIPFMSAAVGDWDDEIDQINTVFFLLQEDPAIIKSFAEKIS